MDWQVTDVSVKSRTWEKGGSLWVSGRVWVKVGVNDVREES